MTLKGMECRATANPYYELEKKCPSQDTLLPYDGKLSQYIDCVSTKYFSLICQKIVIMNLQMYAI